MAKARRESSVTAIAAGIALIVLGALFFGMPKTPFAYATGTGSLGGYAWSDNIGWISLNCSDGGPNGSNICAANNYGIMVGSDGSLSGYAWSDNIGWISANAADLAGCPTAPCTATMINGKLAGWLKALSADGRGWDGWISLSGSGYGPVASGGTFTNYAWGSDVVGWVSFADATSQCTQAYQCVGTDGQTIQKTDQYCVTSTVTTCVSPGYCVDGASSCYYPKPDDVSFTSTSGNAITGLTALPSLVRSGDPTTLYWDVENVSSCMITSDHDPKTWSTSSSGASGVETSPITQQTKYTLVCTGLDKSTFTESAVVKVVPTFNEH